ncbi:MAG: S8 family serine peptidase [Candidatus Helarchaeota archaeon]
MRNKKSIFFASLICFLICISFLIQFINYHQLRSSIDENILINQKIKFNKFSLFNSNNPIIINFKKNTDLNKAKEDIIQICGQKTPIILFNYISAIFCNVNKQDILKIAKLSFVVGIYKNEKFSINLSKVEKSISYQDIFQLEQCADTIKARAIPYTGKGVNISILDTGIDFSHSDLKGKMLAQVSFVTTAYGFDADEVEDANDYDGHGTHCAGIATGTGVSSPPSYNITGIAPDAKLLNAKCLDKQGVGYLSGILAAIEWSINNKASIISMSLGFSTSDPDHPICRAVDNATKKGIVIVASSGNSGPFYSTVGSPASARLIITVGASDKEDRITDFSSRGPTSEGYVDPDVVAPGKNILSAAAKDSLLGKIMQLQGEYVYGRNSNNYMVLSGTSMSCPMVAGAVALLLEAFPSLNPYTVRIALMKGADNLGYTPNIEGAGRINLNKSYQILLHSAPNFNITTVLPKNLPIPPFDYSMFPGDHYSDNIIFLSSIKANYSVRCIGNISEFVSLIPYTSNEISKNNSFLYIMSTSSQFTDIKIDFNFPIVIQPGVYNGLILIKNNDTNEIVDQVNLSFNIRIPKGRIYFDCYHNSDYGDTALENYYNFTKLLLNNQIDLDFKSSLINYPSLSQYDLLILPDIENPLTDNEIFAIKKFWDNGGNILILGNYYPSTAIESLNNLLINLNVGINYTKNNIEMSYDMGMLKYYKYMYIKNIITHPITKGISNFTWLTGVGLEVNSSKAYTIAQYTTKPVIAAYNQSNYHKILCFGEERFFYDDLISKKNNQKLALQTIKWLLNGSQKSNSRELRVESIVNKSILELNTNNSTQISFYISDPNSNKVVNNLIPGKNLSCHIFYYNSTHWDTIFTSNLTNINNIGNGAYTLNFSTNLIGYFKLNVTVENLSFGNGVGISYFNTTQSIPKIVHYSLKTSRWETSQDYSDEINNDVYRDVDRIVINLTIQNTNLNLNTTSVNVYINSIDTYRNNIKYLNLKMNNLTTKNAIETNYSLIIFPDNSFPAGSYDVFFEIIDSEGNSACLHKILHFYINDKYPHISKVSSKLNGISFNILQNSLPTPIFYGVGFNIEISGSDSESNLSDMHAYVIIFSYFTIGFYAYLYEPLWSTEIPFDGSSFKAKISLPYNGISQILDETYSFPKSCIIIILLLDSDGEFDDNSYTYAQVSIGSPIYFTVIMIFGLIGICGISTYLVYRFIIKRSKKQRSSIAYYCPNCGATMKETEYICPKCGYSHPVTIDDPNKLDFE